ncbi:MAG: flagellar basal body-associated FliL family protein [Rhodospirillales bacterium]|nr:flagellar basal body-associated FliL family protein [Rhodospirillales bacterium]MBI2979167.1 flagellar basal body-associated FliL family protein [Rhodospirillales bacterium]
MKKIVMIFAILVMLGGGTASILKWLQLGPFQELQKEEKQPKAQKIEEIITIDMDPLITTIFQENRVAALVQIELKLETQGDKRAERIKYLLPVINDAFLKDMHSFMPRLLKAEERVDAEIIRQRLQLIGDKVAGKGLIRNVVIGDIVEQPAR